MSSSKAVTLGQQYHIGEKPTVILYTSLIAIPGHQTIQNKLQCIIARIYTIQSPAPSETCWFREMSVGGSFRRV